MFVRVKSTPNSPRRSVQIVENTRHGNKTTQKIVFYVGIAMDDDGEVKLKALAEETIIKIEKQRLAKQQSLFKMSEEELDTVAQNKALGRKKRKCIEDIIPIDKVLLKDVFEESRIIEGVEEIATDVYNDLGFNELLDSKRYASVLKDVVLTRLIEPYSKLKLCRLMLEDFGKDYNEDQVYRMMDKIYDKIDDIKLRVFNKTYALMPEINVLLFDVTTLYCESIIADELREFGFSKDGKFNNTQIVLALATNELGLPIGYELFQGNYAEVKTLCVAVDNWKKLFKIGQVCFIGDRAMFSGENLQTLEDYGYNYIIAAKLRSLPDSMQERILDENNYKIEGFAKEIGWVGNFECPVEDGYVCKIVTNINEIKPGDSGYIIIGTKGNFSEVCHINKDGVATYIKISNSELQAQINKLRLSQAKCNCEIMTINEYEKAKSSNEIKSYKAILIIKDDEVIGETTIPAHLAMIAYNNKICELKKLSTEQQQQIIKEGNNLKLSAKLMSTIFTDYVAVKQLTISHELMTKLFPEHNFAVRRLCVSYKTARAKNDNYKRNKLLEKLKKKQGKSQQLLRTPAKQYMTNISETISLDNDKITRDQDWDGIHGIITNIHDDHAKNLIQKYSNLWRIEEAFRVNKHNLKMRPIYHYKPERIKSHIALCYMTFTILKLIQYRTQLTQPRYTIDNIIETMLSVQSSILTHKVTKDQYRLPGRMTNEASALYRAFGIKRSLDAEIYIREAK